MKFANLEEWFIDNLSDQAFTVSFVKCYINCTISKLILLDNKEKEWLNNYHKIVFKEIAPFLNNDQRSWLEVSCSPIH